MASSDVTETIDLQDGAEMAAASLVTKDVTSGEAFEVLLTPPDERNEIWVLLIDNERLELTGKGTVPGSAKGGLAMAERYRFTPLAAGPTEITILRQRVDKSPLPEPTRKISVKLNVRLPGAGLKPANGAGQPANDDQRAARPAHPFSGGPK